MRTSCVIPAFKEPSPVGDVARRIRVITGRRKRRLTHRLGRHNFSCITSGSAAGSVTHSLLGSHVRRPWIFEPCSTNSYCRCNLGRTLERNRLPRLDRPPFPPFSRCPTFPIYSTCFRRFTSRSTREISDRGRSSSSLAPRRLTSRRDRLFATVVGTVTVTTRALRSSLSYGVASLR